MADLQVLTRGRRKAIPALLTSNTIEEAAERAEIGERTLYRYLTEPRFRAALVEAEGLAIDAATRRLIGLQDQAIDTLEKMLSDNTVSDTNKRLAAQAVLDYLMKLRELRSIEQRIAALEDQVYAQSKR